MSGSFSLIDVEQFSEGGVFGNAVCGPIFWRTDGEMILWLEHFAPVGAVGHLLFDGIGDDIVTFAELPTAAEGAVGVDDAGDGGGLGSGVREFDGELRLLGGEDRGVVGLACFVAGEGERGGEFGGFHGGLEIGHAGASLVKLGQTIFDIFLGGEHGILVSEDGALERGVLLADLVDEAAVVEDGHGDSASCVGDDILPVENVTEFLVAEITGGEAERAGEGEGGEEVGDLDADEGAFGSGVEAGLADIGSATEEIFGNAGGDFGWGLGNFSRFD